MFKQRDSATAYDDHTDAIIALLDCLRDDLHRHSLEFAKSGGRDWGYPGDLAHVRELLTEAHNFLNDQE